MRQKGFDPDFSEPVDELKMKAVNLLLSLIEGSPETDIIKRMTQSLDNFQIVFQRMQIVYERFLREELGLKQENPSLDFVNRSLTRKSFDTFIKEGFDLYILVNCLADNYPEAKNRLKSSEFEPKQFVAYEFFQDHTGRIEVLIKDQLHRVYFPIKPVCLFLSDDSKKHLMLTVDRESP